MQLTETIRPLNVVGIDADLLGQIVAALEEKNSLGENISSGQRNNHQWRYDIAVDLTLHLWMFSPMQQRRNACPDSAVSKYPSAIFQYRSSQRAWVFDKNSRWVPSLLNLQQHRSSLSRVIKHSADTHVVAIGDAICLEWTACYE